MIPIQHCIIISTLLFLIGLTSLILRKNLFFILVGIEIMINAAALFFILSGNFWKQVDGQIMYLLTISFAAAEASIGLAFLIQMHRRFKTLNIDDICEMHR
ncbi:NADH-quinone oxidoreductase subunit NuoK [Candidatus Tachikawaea gelatinosa]|uniref:NADH-quinone oxidoreductase subunit K n=1 Tax=Candidatus Tachikawaea gelatinosa TaxID=1410383 RepID=A0A090APW4_9ENTR|nr:NADH-quinone oxidoreductase subunit NuoK [Candidatus Tachikawaea gelatinosa]BAP58322.1 NADH-quinone oxidoreductase subunit K [Candidatus Tachikawaea gelatinosa]